MRGPHPMDMVEEVHQEEHEARMPGARGHEYRDKERMGDEGQPYKRGGHVKHHSIHSRERGGYMPEEVEHSQHERGDGNRGRVSHEDEPKGEHVAEGHEEYPDKFPTVGEEKKHGGRLKRKRGGVIGHDGRLDGAEQHKHKLPHHGRKHGGKVHGEKPKERPDRRARGGHVTADLRPETAAGRVSVPEYQRQHELRNRAGHGKDTQGPKGMKGDRHPK